MPHYRYQVCKGQKVLALSTTKREAEDEARRVGGHVEELPEKNPADEINPSAASQLTATQQKKYLGTLTGKAREARAREILYRREHRSDKPFKTDEGQTTKHSSHAAAFERKYGRAPHDTADAARLSGVSKKVLDEVYSRGMAAWQTGHRPGASQHAWAMARVESFLTGGPTSKTADADLARKVGVSNPADQTETPEFKRWFGNSKVVDGWGRPLVVYHGTKRGGFTVFKPRDEYFFTDSREVADTYGSEIYAVFLNIRNPLVVEGGNSLWNRIPFQGDHVNTKYVSRFAKEAGYDGVILLNIYDVDVGVGGSVSNVFVAFEPTQIKSATANRGTFDPHDADIRNPASPTHIPPAAVAAAARKGLEMRASQPPSNRCCTSVGLRRAAQLANRQPVSEATMRRMLSYFQRHEVDKRGKDWGAGSRGEQAWLAWGGDPGFAWVRRVLGK